LTGKRCGPTRRAGAGLALARFRRRISRDRESLLSSWSLVAPGAFAPFTQQPALQALLLPFGGYGSVQLVEYLMNL